MILNVFVDPDLIANEINDTIGRDIETAESITRWIEDNPTSIKQIMQDALASEIAELYEGDL